MSRMYRKPSQWIQLAKINANIFYACFSSFKLTVQLIICNPTWKYYSSLSSACLELAFSVSTFFTAVLASPIPSPPPAASGAACRPEGAFASSRCPPEVCPAPGWGYWAVAGCLGPRPAAPAVHPQAPSRGGRWVHSEMGSGMFLY